VQILILSRMVNGACVVPDSHRPEKHLKTLLLPLQRSIVLYFQLFSIMTTKKRSLPSEVYSRRRPLGGFAFASRLVSIPSSYTRRPFLSPRLRTRKTQTATRTSSAVAQSSGAHSNCWGRVQKTLSFTLSAKGAQFIPTRREQHWVPSTLNGSWL